MKRGDAMRKTFSVAGIWRSAVVALLVGTILNLINQSDALFGDARVVVWRLALTYLVPFAVAIYGSYAALRSR